MDHQSNSRPDKETTQGMEAVPAVFFSKKTLGAINRSQIGSKMAIELASGLLFFLPVMSIRYQSAVRHGGKSHIY